MTTALVALVALAPVTAAAAVAVPARWLPSYKRGGWGRYAA